MPACMTFHLILFTDSINSYIMVNQDSAYYQVYWAYIPVLCTYLLVNTVLVIILWLRIQLSFKNSSYNASSIILMHSVC